MSSQPLALTIVKSVFALVGAAMLAGAGYWTLHQRAFIAKAGRADGVVIAMEAHSGSKSTTYSPVVRFLDESDREVVYHSSTSSSPPAFEVGEKVVMLYNPDDPQDAQIDSFFELYFGPMIVGGMGSIFFLIGFGIILAGRLHHGKIERLKAMGERVQAKVVAVERNTHLRVNGRNPWRVVAQWQNPATGEMHVFNSDNLWYDPSWQLPQGASVPVLVDRANRKSYWIDLSQLPRAVNP